MWVSAAIRTGLVLGIVLLILIDESKAILTERKVPPSHSDGSNKGSVNPQLYRYLKGYYEKAKGERNNRPRTPPRTPGYVSRTGEQSLNNPQKQKQTFLQPKAGVQSGQYRFAQSPNYMQKLKRLAALLKARAAARSRQRQSGQPRPSYQPPIQQRPSAQNGYSQPAPVQPAPRRTYVQPQPAPPPAAPQSTYVQPRPAQPAPQQQPRIGPQYAPPQPVQPQQTYAPPQPAPVPPRPQIGGYGAVPAQPVPAPSPMSYQSLGLPQSPNYRIVQQQPLPTVPTTSRPAQSGNTEALIKLLKASYASLLPLLLNQAKMTSYGVQTIPLYGSNPYRVFGPMTYGPLPKPNLSQMRLSYNTQSFPSTRSHPFSNGGFSGYNSNNNNNNNINNAGSQQQAGYGSSGGSYGSQLSQNSGYGSQSSQNAGYGNVQTFNGSPDVTCGPISEMFCQGRTSGHYSHPASTHCFVQCDHVGRGHASSCSPGTSWKTLGPEPALFNYCS